LVKDAKLDVPFPRKDVTLLQSRPKCPVTQAMGKVELSK